MSGLEARLRKLESISLENTSEHARIRGPMSNIERAARIIWILNHPDKCDPKKLERLTEILSKYIPLKGDKK